MRRWYRAIVRSLAGLLGALCCVAAVLGVVCVVEGYGMYRKAVDAMPVEALVASIESREDYVPFEELPELYVEAVVAVEDKRFWSHGGVDPLAITRALWNDVRTLSLAEGGSTISQQLMKNEYFTQEKKLERKVAEVLAALELESCCDKEEIFALYVNTISFGSGYEGIAAAAEGYFGKQPAELDGVEAVMLAGIPNAPSAYSLDVNPELALERMEQVLQRMEACGRITPQEADALAEQAAARWLTGEGGD